MTEKKLIAASIVAIAVLLVVGGYIAVKLAAPSGGAEANAASGSDAPDGTDSRQSPAPTSRAVSLEAAIERLAAENEALRKQLAERKFEQSGTGGRYADHYGSDCRHHCASRKATRD